ncbi:DUF4365 domain-containing protein [Promicromonospora panici]|uniref:DUF4365 domain-containing protein n=1 Tax=Promicromonospora panici TaxID=2219658 RepID=UPI00101B81B3|nr:DUF4365 domain-containing protein [Promicromonospora panici]
MTSVATSSGGDVVRGSASRATDFMEQFQIANVQAVAAAAGCTWSVPSIDEGIDMMLTHRSSSHQYGEARLELQLKATHQLANLHDDHVTVRMSRDRYDLFRSADVTIHRIVVAQWQPENPADWLQARPAGNLLRGPLHWVSLAGRPASDSEQVTISVPRANVFDDLALCEIMERIGQGGAP